MKNFKEKVVRFIGSINKKQKILLALLFIVIIFVILFVVVKLFDFDEKNPSGNEETYKNDFCDITNNVCYSRGEKYNIESTQYYDDRFIIIGTTGNRNAYFLTNMEGKYLEDGNEKRILDLKNIYSYMEYVDNKLYYDLSYIKNDNTESFYDIVCNKKYKDDDIVSQRYYREYLGNGEFGKEVFVEKKVISDFRIKDIDWNEYCKEVKIINVD